MKSKLAILVGLALAGANAMACYTVYDGRDRILYMGVVAPVDMSMHLREALAKRGYPAGSRMVFDLSTTCRNVSVGELARPAGTDVPVNTIRMERATNRPPLSRGTPSPLFTDRATAINSKLPHVQVAGDIVMVPPAAADRAIRPTVTVLPSTTMLAGEPDTRAMGAGPAVAPAAQKQVVITELRNPAVTIIDNGGSVSVTR